MPGAAIPPAQGADIYEAAEQGNLCAVLHFLHLDPTSLERKDQGDGRSLGKMQLARKLAIFWHTKSVF